jgi:hypothetical protein
MAAGGGRAGPVGHGRIASGRLNLATGGPVLAGTEVSETGAGS